MSKLNVEQLERRDNPATVGYNSATNVITFTAGAGEVNNLVLHYINGGLTLSENGAGITVTSDPLWFTQTGNNVRFWPLGAPGQNQGPGHIVVPEPEPTR